MCGIVGIASVSPQQDHTWLAPACDTLRHRGPDDAGEWWSTDGKVGLGFRRLAIVDLSPGGHQPMRGATGASIVFNGEIYNFRELRQELKQLGQQFHTQSDTEVLIAAYETWGTECLTRLNGMFAFALYDARRQTMFLARDRAGEKPLFYHIADGTLRFASELKALLADKRLSRAIDPISLDCYLAMGYVPGDRCIFDGYRKLSPAHALEFDLRTGGVRIWPYWSIPELDSEAAVGEVDEAALLDELETILEDAVGRQLEADVPVGVLLSGGVDSSLVTAMAVRRSRHVRTFSVGFPGQGALDETEHARLIAAHFGTEHTELVAEPTAADVIPSLARQFDEPMVDSSMIPTWLVSRLVRQHCTVALGGDGGDELFAGYAGYSNMLWMQERLRMVPSPLRRLVGGAAERFLPVGLKGRNYLQGLNVDLDHGLPFLANLFDPTTRRKLLRTDARRPMWAEDIRKARVPLQRDLLQRATRMDFVNYMAEDILVKVDRASMLNSLEVRAPLLDVRVIEFAFGRVPSRLKATTNNKKILLKRLVARVLPPEFDRHRKQGFSVPMSRWLKVGPLRDLCWQVLSDPASLFDRGTVNGLLRGQDRGRNNGERLFALVLFELWRREYGIADIAG